MTTRVRKESRLKVLVGLNKILYVNDIISIASKFSALEFRKLGRAMTGIYNRQPFTSVVII